MKMQKPGLTRAFVMSLVLVTGTPLWSQTTGWLRTSTGSYDYNDTNNWVNGTVNGIWDASLALDANQTDTFGSDTTLLTGLTFEYTNSFNITLRADAGNRTLTPGGDIRVNTVSASRSITLGSTTAGQKLNLNLGGATRIVDVRATAGASLQRSLTFVNAVTNGSLILQGGGYVNFSPANTGITTNTFTALTLRNTALSPNAYADITVAGAMIIDGAGGLNASGNNGGIPVVSLAAVATRNHLVTAASLVRTYNGVVLLRGNNLGAPQGNNTANLKFSTAPTAELIGGGGLADTTTISILPWALGGTNTAVISTFVTYDVANGIRPLSTNTEFAAGITDGSVSSNNVLLPPPSGTTTINSPTTINSLFMPGDDTIATVINGTGTLTVSSGAVFLGAKNQTTTITNITLDFGGAQGVIGFGIGKSTAISSPVRGSGGVVLYQPYPYANAGSAGTGLSIYNNATNSTYTGDTYILGRISTRDGVLPSGTRTGNVYVAGILDILTGSFNGLNGDGTVSRSSSGSGTYVIGGNNANGDFGGIIIDNGPISVIKIGSGTQRFGGSSTYDGTTTVSNGTLVIDGSIISATTVKTLATLAGSGSITKAGTAIAVDNSGTVAPGSLSSRGTLAVSGNVVFGSSCNFLVDAAGSSSDRMAVDGIVSSAGPVTVNATVMHGFGPWKIITATGGITATFTAATPDLVVYKANLDTELWLKKPAKGTFITFQ